MDRELHMRHESILLNRVPCQACKPSAAWPPLEAARKRRRFAGQLHWRHRPLLESSDGAGRDILGLGFRMGAAGCRGSHPQPLGSLASSGISQREAYRYLENARSSGNARTSVPMALALSFPASGAYPRVAPAPNLIKGYCRVTRGKDIPIEAFLSHAERFPIIPSPGASGRRISR